MRKSISLFILLLTMVVCAATQTQAGPYSPLAGQPGSTAIANTSPSFVEWANGYQDLVRGPLNITNPAGGLASFGDPNFAVGPADGSSSHVVSLGDGGQITLRFAQPITNGPGPDLAVFENGFVTMVPQAYLELGFVEVSTNGTDFVRFPSVSLTQTTSQVGSFATIDTTDIDGLAGKFQAGFGTPFDLSQVAGLSPLVDVNHINYVRIIDAIGTINPAFGTHDSLGNLINEPYPTAFSSGGFDLNGVGVLNVIPEPSSLLLLASGIALAGWMRRRRR